MISKQSYLPHNVVRTDRDDGNILLRSQVPLGRVAINTGEWLHRWADEAADRTFIMERSGPGWREITYSETLQQVQALAAAMLSRGMCEETPIIVLSGAGIDHGVLQLAAQYIGVPVAPLAEQYSLIPEARSRLIYCVNKIKPKMVFAENGEAFLDALNLEVFDGIEKLVSRNIPEGATSFEEMLKGISDGSLAETAATVGRRLWPKSCLPQALPEIPKACRRANKC